MQSFMIFQTTKKFHYPGNTNIWHSRSNKKGRAKNARPLIPNTAWEEKTPYSSPKFWEEDELSEEIYTDNTQVEQ